MTRKLTSLTSALIRLERPAPVLLLVRPNDSVVILTTAFLECSHSDDTNSDHYISDFVLFALFNRSLIAVWNKRSYRGDSGDTDRRGTMRAEGWSAGFAPTPTLVFR